MMRGPRTEPWGTPQEENDAERRAGLSAIAEPLTVVTNMSSSHSLRNIVKNFRDFNRIT